MLVMLMRLILGSPIGLEMVLTEGAKTAIQSAAFAAKWVCAIKNQCIKKYSNMCISIRYVYCEVNL